MISTNYSISGKIIDDKSQGTINRAVVVIRQGTHTPGKIIPQKPQDTIPSQSYSVFADASGNYNFRNITQPGYYFVQSFSDYFIPSYFNQSGPSSVFWQQTDSVQINTSLTNKNISMQRDSSTGGGTISGIINGGSNIPDKKIIVYAKSLDYNQSFNYAIPVNGNSFLVNNLPFGRYQIIAQLIGFPDAVSEAVNITPDYTRVAGITLVLNTTGIQDNPVIPLNVELYQNYPNPFNPSTTIQFSLPHSSFLTLKIYNFLGQEIETLASGNYNQGNYSISWNTKNLPSGIYFYSLNYQGIKLSKKMLLIK
jgi:hypothetical protein